MADTSSVYDRYFSCEDFKNWVKKTYAKRYLATHIWGCSLTRQTETLAYAFLFILGGFS